MKTKKKSITFAVTDKQHERIAKLPREIKISEPLRLHLDMILDELEAAQKLASLFTIAPEASELEKK